MHEWRLNGDGVMNMDSIDGSPYLTVKIHICLTPLMGTIQLTIWFVQGDQETKEELLCQLPNLGTKACRIMVETKVWIGRSGLEL